MKKVLLTLIVLFLVASCKTGFQACIPGNISSEVPSKYIPLTTGNKWYYKDMKVDKDTNVLSEAGRTVEIGEIENIYAQDETGFKLAPVFTMLMDGQKSKYYGYMLCSNGVSFVTINDVGTRREVVFGKLIPNDIVQGFTDPNNDKIYWKGMVHVTVPAGKYECFYCEWLDDRWVMHREYYAAGVGMIKSELLTRKGTLQAKMELIKFELK